MTQVSIAFDALAASFIRTIGIDRKFVHYGPAGVFEQKPTLLELGYRG